MFLTLEKKYYISLYPNGNRIDVKLTSNGPEMRRDINSTSLRLNLFSLGLSIYNACRNGKFSFNFYDFSVASFNQTELIVQVHINSYNNPKKFERNLTKKQIYRPITLTR